MSATEKKEVEVKSWKIVSEKTPILSAKELDEWSEKLGIHAMPEMIFNSYIKFSHGDFSLEFNAYDALECAKRNLLEEYKVPNVKVSCAWNEKTIKNDDMSVEKVFEREDGVDWTFTTLYKGSVKRNGVVDCKVEDKGNLSDIDFAKLQRQDEILFYDDVVLYHDELHDHGEGKLNVKVRVMQYGFYILMRFFLRVDNVCVRLMDTRLYHEFGSKVVVRSFTWLESTWGELTSKNPMMVRDPSFMSDPNRLVSFLGKRKTELQNIRVEE